MANGETAADRARQGSFGRSADEYDRLRPEPPVQALDRLLSGRERVVVDLAAGTGQVTRRLAALLGEDAEVVAVEPDPRMLAVLRRRCPRARATSGTAEHLPLADAGVDAVVVGSAWHWFDRDAALAEIARVLRPGGRLGAIGISPDPTVPWVRDLFGGEAEAHCASVEDVYLRVTVPAELFTPVETTEVGFSRAMTSGDVQRLFATHSNYLVADDRERARLDRLVHETLDRRCPGAGPVELPFRAWCWSTRRLPR